MNEQKFAFQEQIKILLSLTLLSLPSSKRLHEPFLEILDEYVSEIDKGVVHCFTGTKNNSLIIWTEVCGLEHRMDL